MTTPAYKDLESVIYQGLMYLDDAAHGNEEEGLDFWADTDSIVYETRHDSEDISTSGLEQIKEVGLGLLENFISNDILTTYFTSGELYLAIGHDSNEIYISAVDRTTAVGVLFTSSLTDEAVLTKHVNAALSNRSNKPEQVAMQYSVICPPGSDVDNPKIKRSVSRLTNLLADVQSQFLSKQTDLEITLRPEV